VRGDNFVVRYDYNIERISRIFSKLSSAASSSTDLINHQISPSFAKLKTRLCEYKIIGKLPTYVSIRHNSMGGKTVSL
jgi:hypothetical protein